MGDRANRPDRAGAHPAAGTYAHAADPDTYVDVAGLRARVVVAVCAFSVATLLALALVDPSGFPVREHAAVGLTVAAYLLVLGCWAARRGARLSDREFFVAVLGSLALDVLLMARNQQPGSAAPVEQCLLIPALLAAVFSRDRRQTAVAFAVTAAGICWLIWLRLGWSSAVGTAMVLEVNVYLVAVIVTRILREVSFGAIAQAAEGELTDPLTGLANRRGLERRAPASWARVAEQRGAVTFLVVDIDHFKRVNDTFGHAAGDALIRQVADVLRESLRQGDVAVRLGGEEFLVLAQAPLDRGAVIAERLRATIEQRLHPVTVSIGVHGAFPGTADDVASCLWHGIDLADRALYVAKESGRNRVVTSGGAPAARGDVVVAAPHATGDLLP